MNTQFCFINLLTSKSTYLGPLYILCVLQVGNANVHQSNESGTWLSKSFCYTININKTSSYPTGQIDKTWVKLFESHRILGLHNLWLKIIRLTYNLTETTLLFLQCCSNRGNFDLVLKWCDERICIQHV